VTAARSDDLYAPVAAAARRGAGGGKVAVLGAMYGQTTGTAPRRCAASTRPTRWDAYLDSADRAGRAGRDLRTYGGGLNPADGLRAAEREPGRAYGRYARNAMIQGAAAELFKVWRSSSGPGARRSAPGSCCCLHDELLVHVPYEQAERCPGWSTSACRKPRSAGRPAAGSVSSRHHGRPQLVGRQERGPDPAVVSHRTNPGSPLAELRLPPPSAAARADLSVV